MIFIVIEVVLIVVLIVMIFGGLVLKCLVDIGVKFGVNIVSFVVKGVEFLVKVV